MVDGVLAVRPRLHGALQDQRAQADSPVRVRDSCTRPSNHALYVLNSVDIRLFLRSVYAEQCIPDNISDNKARNAAIIRGVEFTRWCVCVNCTFAQPPGTNVQYPHTNTVYVLYIWCVCAVTTALCRQVHDRGRVLHPQGPCPGAAAGT